MSPARPPSPAAQRRFVDAAPPASERGRVHGDAHEGADLRRWCIHEVFEAQAGRTPNAIAVRCGAQTLTYAQLNQRADALAEDLIPLGVGPDVCVGICLERSLEMVIALLATLKAGGAYLPLDPAYPDSRLIWMLQNAAPRVLLAGRATKGRAFGLTTPVAGAPSFSRPAPLFVDAAALARATPTGSLRRHRERHRPQPSDLAYVAYTSGSTGQPKGIEILHRGVTRLVVGADYVSLGAEEILLQLAPLAFDASTFEIWGPLLNGGQLVLMPPGAPTLEEIGETIRRHGVTTLWLTSGLFHAMVEQRLDDLRSLRQLLAGGDVLSPRAVQRAKKELPACRLINGYGPTESTTFACCHTVDTLDPDQPVPIGRPIAGTTAHVLDAELQPVPVGSVGELHLGGEGLARGYLNQPDLTARKFIPDPFSIEPHARLYRTGDLVRQRADGIFEFVGRLDHQVKIRGFRVEPAEIEAALRTFPGIADVVVTARDNPAGGKSLVAYVVAGSGQPPGVADLREFLRDRLPDYMAPAGVVSLTRLPLNASGKVDRQALPDWTPAEPRHGDVLPPATTPTELQLKQIWERVLGLRPCGIRDSFFDLGGDSLLAFRLIAEINRLLHCDLRVTALFQHPSIEQMARMLDTAPRPKAEARVVTLQEGRAGVGAPLYFIQADAGNFHLVQLAALVDRSRSVFGTDVPLDRDVLQAAADGQSTRLPSIAEIAAAHVALILEHQPAGPCALAGYCYTGVLAWEVAAQLERHGRHVEAVLILELPLHRLGWWRRFNLRVQTEMAFARLRLKFYWHKANSPLRAELVRLIARQAAHTTRRRPAPLDRAVPPWSVALDRIQLQAVDRYRLKPLATRAVLFNAQRSVAAFDAADRIAPIAPLLGGGLEIVEVPGDHWSVVKEPHLAVLAAGFNRALGTNGQGGRSVRA